jgi:hypothetical protein
MLSSELLFWYTSVQIDIVQLNIHLELRLHLLYNWTMDFTLNLVLCKQACQSP